MAVHHLEHFLLQTQDIEHTCARIDAARLIVRKDLFEAQGIAEALDSLHGMAGARGIYDHYPIRRLFRDAHSLMGYIAFSWDAQASPWGLVALGGDYAAPATLGGAP